MVEYSLTELQEECAKRYTKICLNSVGQPWFTEDTPFGCDLVFNKLITTNWARNIVLSNDSSTLYLKGVLRIEKDESSYGPYDLFSVHCKHRNKKITYNILMS